MERRNRRDWIMRRVLPRLRRLALWPLLGAALAGCGPPEPAGDAAADASEDALPPNFVIVMADDLGYGDISPYGGWIETPNLERLAAGGIRFTDFHTSANVCSPTRAGLLTGLYQQRLGIPGVLFADPARPSHFEGLGAEHTTIAEVLRGAGYATAIFGKWHLGYQAEFNPTLHGFDEFRGFVSGNIDYHSHVDLMARPDWWRGAELEVEEGYLTDLVTDHALRFLNANADRPFLLYLPHHAPHFPYQGRGDPADRVAGGERSFDTRGSVADRKRAYREMVEAMDEGVGRVVAELDRLGIAERTIIWFFSDNGAVAELGSNGPLRGSKGTDWEGGHRVPSILSWPRRMAPRPSAALASTLDVMPTVLAWASVDYAGDQDGIDLGPIIADEASATGDRRLFWGGDGVFWRGAAMREGRFKLMIEPAEDGAESVPQLFDLDQDLAESQDIAAAHPERVTRMVAALEQWKRDVGGGAND